jgi:hypothetical protein
MSLALELTIFSQLFAAVAEEIGIVLRKSAFSPNIKERREGRAIVSPRPPFKSQRERLCSGAFICG